MLEEIHTTEAPAAIGPYSQAIKVSDFLFLSGQIGLDPANGEVVPGIKEQTHRVMKNIQAILQEAGADFSHVVKFTIYLASMEDFSTVNEVYGSYLQKPYPARATIEVSRLPKDVLIEIDAIVYQPSNANQ